MTKLLSTSFDGFYERIRDILEGARNKVYRTANIEMLQAYWNVGREIVEEEQKGRDRAGYGSFLVKNLSVKLTLAFGKGFTQSNLRYMRLFYQTFEKRHALRDELSWTHYRLLLKVDTENAREFYIQESIAGNWSTRQLDRQINSLYFERILMSSKQRRQAVIEETDNKKEKMQPSHFIKDPFVLEFLDVNTGLLQIMTIFMSTWCFTTTSLSVFYSLTLRRKTRSPGRRADGFLRKIF